MKRGPDQNQRKRRKSTPTETAVRTKKRSDKKSTLATATAAAVAGKVRECCFCKVVVLAEHVDSHVKGKKHLKLADKTPTDQCWQWVEPPPQGPATESVTPPTLQVEAEGQGGGRWHAASRPKRRPGAPKVASAAVEQVETLPTLGFKVNNGVDPILPLIRSGQKSVELRRRALLSTRTASDLPLLDRGVAVRQGGLAPLQRPLHGRPARRRSLRRHPSGQQPDLPRGDRGERPDRAPRVARRGVGGAPGSGVAAVARSDRLERRCAAILREDVLRWSGAGRRAGARHPGADGRVG